MCVFNPAALLGGSRMEPALAFSGRESMLVMPMRHRSLVQQTLHYFSRPQERLPDGAVGGASAWNAKDFADGGWREHLSEDEVAELRQAVEVAVATGKPRSHLSKTDFPLPLLATKIADWRRELSEGRGFVVVRGVPVGEWRESESETFFWCLGMHLGVCGAQNPDGDLLGHVRDQRIGVDDVTVRAYRTNAEIRFHCDAADVVGLLCLEASKTGGRSRIASSVSVFNTLFEENRALAMQLFEPLNFDTKAEGSLRFFPIRPCAFAEGTLRTFYHADYFREVERHPDAPRLRTEQRAMLQRYDEIASDDSHCLEMDLLPGDMQLLSNHTIVHARSAYIDHDAPEERRHLLRLWLSLPHRDAWSMRWLAAKARVALLARLAQQRVVQTTSAYIATRS